MSGTSPPMISDDEAALAAGEIEADDVPEDRFTLECARDIPHRAESENNHAVGFCVASYRVLLTGAALSENELTVERAHAELVENCRGGVHEIVVCQERHKHPEDHARRWHIHTYVWM